MSNGSVSWYKQFWPWFLISIPASAVVAGFVMLWLALNSQHSMVVDDYYKYGKTINKRIERDVTAASLGLSATLTPMADHLKLALASTAPTAPGWPDQLQIRAIHPSDARHDMEFTLNHQRDGIYVAAQLLMPGRWQIHIEPSSGLWRLVSKTSVVEQGKALSIQFRDGLLPGVNE